MDDRPVTPCVFKKEKGYQALPNPAQEWRETNTFIAHHH
jgi:hypothetical protein